MEVPTLSVSVTRPAVGAAIVAGCRSATLWGRPVASPKRTRESAAFPRTMGEESASILNKASWNAMAEGSWPMTQASVLRTSSTGCAAKRTNSGYQPAAVASRWARRSPNCTRACWMWRGCLSSFRYSTICWSESWRPNQVFHQNKKGMRTISQAVKKKRRRLRVDMRCRARAGGAGEFSMEISSRSKGSDWGTSLAMLTRLGCRRLLRRSGLAFLQRGEDTAIAQFQEDVQKKNAGERQKNEAHEHAVDRGDGAGDEDPGDARERDEAEQDGNQEHQEQQDTSSSSFVWLANGAHWRS